MPARITLANSEPVVLAGLWAQWRSPEGETVHSLTMLTINADDHPYMRNFHKTQDEERSVVILPPEQYDEWLQDSAEESEIFLRAWPADMLAANSQQTSLFN